MTKSKQKTKGNTIAKTTMVPLQSGASSKTSSTVVTGKNPDADANTDADADADANDNNGGNNNVNANADADDDSNDNDQKYGDVANATTTMLQSGVSKKGSTTTENKAIDISAAIATMTELENMGAKNSTTKMPGINNAATMTGTPIAEHDSSGSVAVHD